MRVVVVGGTGTIGRHVVAVAGERGHDVVVLSRSTGADLLTGAGVGAALHGADVVVDAIGTDAQSARAAGGFFTTTAQTLQAAAAAAGVGRILLVSIVGLERAKAYGYYGAKLAQERAHRAGSAPVTVVRATQCHELAGQILARTRLGPVAAVPRMRTQPIAARTVAEHLVDAAGAVAHPDLVQIGGPQPEDLLDLARRLVASRGDRVRVLPLPVPGAAGRALRDGSLLPGADATLAGPTFGEWLAGLAGTDG